MGKKIFGNLLFVAALAGCVGMTLLMGSQGTKESMMYNLIFLAIMVVLYFAGLIGGFFRMSGLEHDFQTAAKKAERNDPTLKTDKIFAIRSIDKQLKDFWGYAKSSKGGIADVEDYINEDLVDNSIHRSLLEMIPDMLTSLGILGTFIGLVWGLKNFNPANYDAMTSSVASLVEGIKVAFLTSIYGLALALVYTYNMRSSYDSLITALDEFLDKFHANVMPSAEMESKNLMISFQQTQAESINRMADQFSDQLADSFEKVITPAFRKMNQSLDLLVTSMTKGQEEMVKGVLDEFLKQMNSSFKLEFDGFNKAVTELTKAQESNAVYTKQLYQQLAAELNATFQQEQKNMHQQIQDMVQSQGQYMVSADQVMQDSQRIMKEQQNAYKQIMDYMKEAEQTSAKFWVACNQTMQKYVNAAASGLEGFTMSQKYNEQIFEANTRLIENYSEKVDEYMAAQKEVSAALEQIKRVFEDLAVSRDDKNVYLHRGNLQNVSSNRELVQQMENMLKEEQENQRETMQEMSEWVQELAKNGGKANAKFGFFKNKNDR